MQTFRDYYLAIPTADRDAFAKRCGSSEGYFSLLASGHRKASERLAIAIERESGGQVRVETMCPEADWAVIRGKGGLTQRPVEAS